MASLEIRALRKEYDDAIAVNDLTFAVEDGEFCAVLGPSGCGKSTTLRMVAGLETPTSGHVIIDGVDVTHVAPGKRDIGMVFQNYALYPHMSVAENIGFPLKIRKTPKSERNMRVGKVAELLGLSALLDRKPKQLSGGQRQRVALGRAIVREPKVFLFDEPLSNLDARLRTDMRREIRVLQQELGVTSLYVTHDQVEAMTMGDKILVLKDGELQQFAAPKVVYDHPQNEFVATFLGSPTINIVQGEFSADGEFRSEFVQFAMPKPLSSGRASIAFRPEHICFREPEVPHFCLHVQDVTAELHGHEFILQSRVGTMYIQARSHTSDVPTAWYVPLSKLHCFKA